MQTVQAQKQVFAVRALHFVLRAVDVSTAERLARQAATAGFTTLVVQITDGLDLPGAPWTPRRDAWTVRQFTQWLDGVHALGMEVVPELKLLSHQTKFIQDPHSPWLYNRLTYNPQQAGLYAKVVFPVIDRLLQLMHPKAFHIGHDEVIGWSGRHKAKVLGLFAKTLPAELFLQDVQRLHAYLKERGVATWMWGDMLLAPREFPGMLKNHLHGGKQGYGAQLRRRLPKDIVICDWHYFDKQTAFPSLATMQREGFRVLGASWRKTATTRAFARYAAGQHVYGMIATTWFHVQRHEWQILDPLIADSGRIFASP